MRPKILKYGGRGVDVKLASYTSPGPDTIFWSPQQFRDEKDSDGNIRKVPAGGFNSFCCVEDEKHGQWLTDDGTKVALISINGVGEIRWRVDCSLPHYAEGAEKHFNLKPIKERSNISR